MKEKETGNETARVVDVDGVKVDVRGDVTDAEVKAWMKQIEEEDAEDEKKG